MRVAVALLLAAGCGGERAAPAPTAGRAVATASSGDPADVADGDPATRWRPATREPGQWVKVELGGATSVGAIEITSTGIASARVIFSDRRELDLALPADTGGPLRIPTPPRVTRSLELIIDAVHPGADVSVAELRAAPP